LKGERIEQQKAVLLVRLRYRRTIRNGCAPRQSSGVHAFKMIDRTDSRSDWWFLFIGVDCGGTVAVVHVDLRQCP
jgi:hypothetical protein